MEVLCAIVERGKLKIHEKLLPCIFNCSVPVAMRNNNNKLRGGEEGRVNKWKRQCPSFRTEFSIFLFIHLFFRVGNVQSISEAVLLERKFVQLWPQCWCWLVSYPQHKSMHESYACNGGDVGMHSFTFCCCAALMNLLPLTSMIFLWGECGKRCCVMNFLEGNISWWNFYIGDFQEGMGYWSHMLA